MLRMLKSISILAAGVLLVACASGPRYADMKSSIPPLAADKGRIYFYRSNSMLGAAIQPSIVLNGEKVGDSQPGGVFYIDRPPGKYEAMCGTEVERKASFVLSAGQERFVKTTISMGAVAGHVTPELVDSAAGMAAIQSLHFTAPKTAQNH